MKKKVGLIGWRGMVGSVLISRMEEEGDFKNFEPYFFSTSQVGEKSPIIKDLNERPVLLNANKVSDLENMDILLTCQGSDYTNRILPELRSSNWGGFWIDASSALRMNKGTNLSLDPINLEMIKDDLQKGVLDYVGGNCTVSLMLMAIGGLFKEGLVDWVNTNTYQAASGAGSQGMRELLSQMGHLHLAAKNLLDDEESSILKIDQTITNSFKENSFPTANWGVPLAGSLIPWIDKEMENGQSREEWKGMCEANKILGKEKKPIAIDGTCVRVGSMRCHSQALMIKLNQNISISKLTEILKQQHSFVKVIPNIKEMTEKELTPVNVSGSLNIPIGRIRKMNLGEKYLNIFTVGDQLLWGAAEPLRRVLNIILTK